MTTSFFELSAKTIASLRKAPDASFLPFACDEDLLALVACWPWLPKIDPLLLTIEADPIFWLQVGGQRTDLVGFSKKGRAVACEVMLDPFIERKPSMRRLLRGLCRLDTHNDDPRLLAPYSTSQVDHMTVPLTAIFVADGAVFPKDPKQLKKIHKDMRALLDDTQEAWPAETPADNKEDRRTPLWVKQLGGRKLDLIIIGLTRIQHASTYLVRSERLLQVSL
jgi:hypothetical protein